MNNFNKSDFNEIIDSIVPSYQRSTLRRALDEDFFDIDTAGLTLTGELNTLGMVVLTSKTPKANTIWSSVVAQVYDYICTKSATYKSERAGAEATLKHTVNVIAVSLAATYHLALGVVTGLVTLALMSILKLGKNAWCDLYKTQAASSAAPKS